MTTAIPAAPDLTGSSSPVSSVQTPMIEVRDLVKRYKGADRNAVDGISFEVRRGELFAFLGPNGAGKTTTVSILTTTLAPTSGSIRIAGHDLDRGASAIRREIGIIFQQPSLDLNLTGEHNLRFHASLFGIYPPAQGPGPDIWNRHHRARRLLTAMRFPDRHIYQSARHVGVAEEPVS